MGKVHKKRVQQKRYPINEDIFTKTADEVEKDREEWIRTLTSAGVMGYRVKEVWNGPYLDVRIYPYTNREVKARIAKHSETKSAQHAVNVRNRYDHVNWTLNENFGAEDTAVTCTYSNENLPKTVKEAKKCLANFTRRLKTYQKKHGLELKYVAVTEYKDEEGKDLRIHHHMVMNIADRDVIERLWDGGGFTNCKRLKPDERGLEAQAKYMLKQPRFSKYEKSYSASRNLSKYDVKLRDDKRFSKKKVSELFRGEVIANDWFEKIYKDHFFTRMAQGKVSDYVDGCYLRVQLRAKDPNKKRRKRNLKPEEKKEQQRFWRASRYTGSGYIDQKEQAESKETLIDDSRVAMDGKLANAELIVKYQSSNKLKEKEAAEKQMQLVVSYKTKGKLKSAIGIVTVPKDVDLLISDGTWHVRKLDEKLTNVIVNEISNEKAKLILEKLGREDLLLKHFNNKEKE